MAKGNLFLGMARGSVGDVTFYRADGQQLSRARNRAPRNPKTDAQTLQRAISATISQAYKAGKVIFDHSFEGKQIPGGNQRQFLSVNMRRLRSLVLGEMTRMPEDALAAVVSPGATYPVPNSYRISEGSLVQSLFSLSAEGETPVLTAKMTTANEGESVAQYINRLAITPGEIFTVCALGVGGGYTEVDLVSPVCVFGFVRLIVKDDVLESTTPMATATFGDIFKIDESGSTFPATTPISTGITLATVIQGGNNVTGAMGVIRSRENSGLRSTSDMYTLKDLNSDSTNAWGVKPINLWTAWSDASGGVDSSLILEGGGF